MQKKEFWIMISSILLILTAIPMETKASLLQEEEESTNPYWYTFEEFKANPLSEWIPFFSTTDIPLSQPMRGFISDSRNWFIDMGSFEWFSDWVTDIWGYNIDLLEKNISSAESIEELHGFYYKTFSQMKNRLTSMGLSLNYAKDLHSPTNGWVPVIVIDNLTNNGYAESDLENWAVDSNLVTNEFSNALPIVDWESDVYWYDYYNETNPMYNFSLIADDFINDESYLITDYSFTSLTDQFITNIVTTKLAEEHKNYDVIFPSIVFLLANTTLYYPGFGAIGGLGQIDSLYDTYSYWNLNGRNQYAFFSGGDPESPRDSLTSTVIHEGGHTLGLPHPHAPSVFGGSPWIFDATTISTMTYYSRSVNYDRLEKDLILNCVVLQLMGRFLDDLEYFEQESLNGSQIELLEELEIMITNIPNLLINNNTETLKLNIFEIDFKFDDLALELAIPRKSSSFSSDGPELDVKLDFIIGPGIEESDELYNMLSIELDYDETLYLCPQTELPAPRYHLEKEVFKVSSEYERMLKEKWFSLLKEDNTSLFDPDNVPVDAWDTFPRDRVFQTQNGYSLDAKACEDWLTENPATLDEEGVIHYRFYLFNLDGLVEERENYSSTTESNTNSNGNKSTYGGSFEILILALFPVSFYFKRVKKD